MDNDIEGLSLGLTEADGLTDNDWLGLTEELSEELTEGLTDTDSEEDTLKDTEGEILTLSLGLSD
jgi:hypothetical protein